MPQEKNLQPFSYLAIGYAIVGLLLSHIITGIMIYKVICIVQKQKIQNYEELIHAILPEKAKHLLTIGNNIINLFLLISFYIMIAGFATYFKQEFSLPMIVGILLILIFTYIACNSNICGIKKISTVLIPILMIVVIHIWFKNVDNQVIENMILEENKGNVILACIKAILYSSYNSILLIPMIIEVAKNTSTRKKAQKIAIVTGIILFVLSYFLTTLLYQEATNQILKTDLPVLELVKIIEPKIQKIYGIMIAIAIVTSAIAAMYGYLKNISKTRKSYQKWLIFLCLTAIPIAYIGFSNLINTLYPIFGMIGFIQILLIWKQK